MADDRKVSFEVTGFRFVDRSGRDTPLPPFVKIDFTARAAGEMEGTTDEVSGIIRSGMAWNADPEAMIGEARAIAAKLLRRIADDLDKA